MTIPDDLALVPGDIVLVEFGPVRGTEQDGRRPALVVSVENVHRLTRRAIVCPITSNAAPWPSKVFLPPGLSVSGAVLTDQIRSIDRRERILRRLGSVPESCPDRSEGPDRDPARPSQRVTSNAAHPMTTTLYYAPGACSLASHIALEESGMPFESVRLDLAKGDQRAPEYLAVNQRGRVPALVEEGWVLTENTAILRHVARSASEAGLWPADLREQAMADEWLCWLSTNHHPAYAHIRRTERYTNDETAYEGIRAKGLDTYGDLCTMTEVRLSNGGWAVGRYSVVDPYLLLFWTWARGPACRFDMAERFPAWTAHARAMAERPAVRAVFAREGLDLPA